MSHMKKMLEEHEDGVCDRSTCLKCAEDGPTILTPPQDEDGTQPLIRPDELEAAERFRQLRHLAWDEHDPNSFIVPDIEPYFCSCEEPDANHKRYEMDPTGDKAKAAIQAQLQARVNELQGKTPLQGMMDQTIARLGLAAVPEYKADDDLNRAIEGANLLMEYNVLCRFAHEYPAKYECLRRTLLEFEADAMDLESEARSDYERDELVP